jgi:hypothetical protein
VITLDVLDVAFGPAEDVGVGDADSFWVGVAAGYRFMKSMKLLDWVLVWRTTV